MHIEVAVITQFGDVCLLTPHFSENIFYQFLSERMIDEPVVSNLVIGLILLPDLVHTTEKKKLFCGIFHFNLRFRDVIFALVLIHNVDREDWWCVHLMELLVQCYPDDVVLTCICWPSSVYN